MYALDARGVYTPFTRAASDNNVELLQLFLKHGVDVNFQYKGSETALTFAGKSCNDIHSFKLLLNNGANPNLIDHYNQTTKSGLERYCRDSSNYNQFMNLLSF